MGLEKREGFCMRWVNLHEIIAISGTMVTVSGTIIAIIGGLLGLRKFFTDKHEIIYREWQKVVIQKLFEQTETPEMSFGNILEKYRIEARTIKDFNLKKGEISENSLRRVLIELVTSDILCMQAKDNYKLNIDSKKTDFPELQR
jgi:hypothetical protein